MVYFSQERVTDEGVRRGERLQFTFLTLSALKSGKFTTLKLTALECGKFTALKLTALIYLTLRSVTSRESFDIGYNKAASQNGSVTLTVRKTVSSA